MQRRDVRLQTRVGVYLLGVLNVKRGGVVGMAQRVTRARVVGISIWLAHKLSQDNLGSDLNEPAF